MRLKCHSWEDSEEHALDCTRMATPASSSGFEILRTDRHVSKVNDIQLARKTTGMSLDDAVVIAL
jgi:hypothetical protein